MSATVHHISCASRNPGPSRECDCTPLEQSQSGLKLPTRTEREARLEKALSNIVEGITDMRERGVIDEENDDQWLDKVLGDAAAILGCACTDADQRVCLNGTDDDDDPDLRSRKCRCACHGRARP